MRRTREILARKRHRKQTEIALVQKDPSSAPTTSPAVTEILPPEATMSAVAVSGPDVPVGPKDRVHIEHQTVLHFHLQVAPKTLIEQLAGLFGARS